MTDEQQEHLRALREMGLTDTSVGNISEELSEESLRSLVTELKRKAGKTRSARLPLIARGIRNKRDLTTKIFEGLPVVGAEVEYPEKHVHGTVLGYRLTVVLKTPESPEHPYGELEVDVFDL